MNNSVSSSMEAGHNRRPSPDLLLIDDLHSPGVGFAEPKKSCGQGRCGAVRRPNPGFLSLSLDVALYNSLRKRSAPTIASKALRLEALVPEAVQRRPGFLNQQVISSRTANYDLTA